MLIHGKVQALDLALRAYLTGGDTAATDQLR